MKVVRNTLVLEWLNFQLKENMLINCDDIGIKISPLIAPVETVRFSNIKNLTSSTLAIMTPGTNAKIIILEHFLHLDVPKV